MQFSGIIGQSAVKQRLVRSAKEGRISHAQLFFGPSGTGGLAMAIAYAQFLLCQSPGENDSCGACASCKQAAKLSHPDLHFSFPLILDKDHKTSDSHLAAFRELFLEAPYMSYNDLMEALDAENKQGVIGVEECNEVLRKLSLTSYAGGFKIMIIWLPEKMNQSGANKLLKIIEEPPDKTVFILVTENEDQLLRTIVSRTQLVKITRLSDEDIRQALMERKQLSAEEAAKVAYLADGSFREALHYVGFRAEEDYNFQQFRNWMRMCYKAEIVNLQKWAAEIAGEPREAQKGFLTYGLHMIREALLINYADPSLVRLSGEELEFLKKFAPFIHSNNSRKMIEEFNLALTQLSWNANSKILFTDLSLRFSQLIKAPVPGNVQA